MSYSAIIGALVGHTKLRKLSAIGFAAIIGILPLSKVCAQSLKASTSVNIKDGGERWIQVENIPVLRDGKPVRRATEAEIRALMLASGVEYAFLSSNSYDSYISPIKASSPTSDVATHPNINKIYPLSTGSDLYHFIDKAYKDYGSDGRLKIDWKLFEAIIKRKLSIDRIDNQINETPEASGRIFSDFSFGDSLKIALEKLSDSESMSLLSVSEQENGIGVIKLIAKIGEFAYELQLFFPEGKLKFMRISNANEKEATAAYNSFIKNSEKTLDNNGVVTVVINGQSVTIGEKKALNDASIKILSDIGSMRSMHIQAVEGQKYLSNLLSLRYKSVQGGERGVLYSENKSVGVEQAGNGIKYRVHIFDVRYLLEFEKKSIVSEVDKMVEKFKRVGSPDKIANELF